MRSDSSIRTVKKLWHSKPTLEGAGVRLKRAFGFTEVPQLDPFLLLDAFHSENPADYKRGFPWHPHRGIETITYILDGEVEHADSMGNRGVIAAGDVQWMTAGGGIIHQEMPFGDARGEMWGFQLWSNLPASQKLMDPRYREVKQAAIPLVKTPGGAEVRVISGEVAGVKGPVQEIVTDPELLDVSLSAGQAFTHPVKPDHTVFAYVIEGEGDFDAAKASAARGAASAGSAGTAGRGTGASASVGSASAASASPEGTLVLYGPGNSILVRTEKRPVRFLLVSGRPLGEPVAWYGPIVMNTQAELEKAFEEYERGTFVKSPGTPASGRG